jgi:hypothetical protein
MRTKVLIVGLVAVLALVAFAFWRAAAGPGARRAGQENDPAATPAPPAVAPASPAPALPAPPAPSPSPPPAAPAPAVEARPVHPAGALEETQLMTRLRAIKDKDPAGAVQLAREGNRRFAESRDAPERTAILIHALVAVDKGSEARGEAEQMVNHYPDSAWVREVERFTGAHRHRNLHVNDAGQIVTQ